MLIESDEHFMLGILCKSCFQNVIFSQLFLCNTQLGTSEDYLVI